MVKKLLRRRQPASAASSASGFVRNALTVLHSALLASAAVNPAAARSGLLRKR
jgi:hypothetical protein